MGKQPYIPLYIGDWEQDTNCISLEAEAAVLKIVFKCWKNKGIFVTNIDSLCRLWKVDQQKFATILLELKTNNIFDIHEREDGHLLFTSRRIVRDLEISAKKAISGSKGGSKTSSKRAANEQQNHDNDIDNDIESEIKEKGVNGISLTGGITNNFEANFVRAFDEMSLESYVMQFKGIDVANELQIFKLKCNANPDDYHKRDTPGLRMGFIHQLKSARSSEKIKIIVKQKSIDHL